MPAETDRQAGFMRLVAYYKKHGHLPEGAGEPTERIKQAASSMSAEQVRHYTSTTKRRGSILTGKG